MGERDVVEEVVVDIARAFGQRTEFVQKGFGFACVHRSFVRGHRGLWASRCAARGTHRRSSAHGARRWALMLRVRW